MSRWIIAVYFVATFSVICLASPTNQNKTLLEQPTKVNEEVNGAETSVHEDLKLSDSGTKNNTTELTNATTTNTTVKANDAITPAAKKDSTTTVVMPKVEETAKTTEKSNIVEKITTEAKTEKSFTEIASSTEATEKEDKNIDILKNCDFSYENSDNLNDLLNIIIEHPEQLKNITCFDSLYRSFVPVNVTISNFTSYLSIMRTTTNSFVSSNIESLRAVKNESGIEFIVEKFNSVRRCIEENSKNLTEVGNVVDKVNRVLDINLKCIKEKTAESEKQQTVKAVVGYFNALKDDFNTKFNSANSLSIISMTILISIALAISL